MSRYVDIDSLEPQQFENSEVELGVLAYDYEAVQSEPYIDIVHCIECKHYMGLAVCEILQCLCGGTDFHCGYGERKEE